MIFQEMVRCRTEKKKGAPTGPCAVSLAARNASWLHGPGYGVTVTFSAVPDPLFRNLVQQPVQDVDQKDQDNAR